MRVAMVGPGYVGLVSGACVSEFGAEVICVDKDAVKIEGLSDAAYRPDRALGALSEVLAVAARGPETCGARAPRQPDRSPVGVIARGRWFGLRRLDPLRCLANRVLGACSEDCTVAERPELVQVSI